jgi:hypothetical protein
LALGFQDRGGLLDIVGRRGGGIGVGFDARDGFRDVPGWRALILDRGSDRCRNLVDLADDAADSLDGFDGVAGDLLNIGDPLRNLVRCVKRKTGGSAKSWSG